MFGKPKKQKDKAFQHAFFTVSIPSFLFTMFFALFNVILGLITKSGWYYAIAGHFFAFAFLRFMIVLYKWFVFKKTEVKEANLHITIGAMICLLIVTLSITISAMIKSGRPSALGTIPAITNALYSFIKIASAIRKLNKAYKKDNYLKRTIRSINLAETLVSFISLSVTLITTFGDGNLESPLFIASASVLCGLIVLLGIKMIVEGIRHRIMLKNRQIILSDSE